MTNPTDSARPDPSPRDEQVRSDLRASEAWLATTLKSIGDAVIATDGAGRVVFLNAVASELTGWSQDEAAGRPLHEIFPIFNERTRQAVENPVDRVLRDGRIVGLANHTILVRRDGQETPIEDSGAPIRAGEGDEISGVVLVFRDATASRKAERQRQRNEFLVRAAAMLSESLSVETICTRMAAQIVPSMVDFSTVWLLRPDGDLLRLAVAPTGLIETGDDLRASPRAPNWSPEHSLRKLIASNRLLVVDDFCAWAAEDSPPEYLEAVRKLGLRRVALVPLYAYGRSVGLFTAAMIDSGREIDGQMLTDLEAFGRLAAISLENGRLFEDTERLRRRAEEANLAKDNFIATVSHELRTPLTSVLGWAKILRTDRLDADMLKRGLEVIERNAMAQAQLIEDLLDVSRIVAGKLEIEPKPILVSTLVESALESARPAASAKGIRLGADIDPEIGSIEADPRRLQQVIWNLVTNAVKFTPREGVIRVTARRADGAVEICVSDSGAGIEAAFLPKVFERFQQAHEGNRAGGLGLGLAIVRHIVEQHGGHVFAESDGRGKGARFVVRLPAPGRPALRDEDRRSPVPAQAAPRALEGARVLVVDDEDDARDLVVTVLQGAGAIATDARSVDEALTAFRAGEVDAVVSDIGMPERDGYALIKELRALERPLARRLPVIALTAFARGEDRTRALVAGFTTHVPKPLEPEELIMVLASALGREVGVPRSK